MKKRREKRPNDKPASFNKSMNKLFKYSKNYLIYIIISLVLISASTIIIVLGPSILEKLTNNILKIIEDNANKQVYLDLIKEISITLLILYSISVILDLTQGVIMADVTERISYNLRHDLSKKMNVLPLKYYDTTNHGDYISRVTNDVDTIGQTFGQGLNTLLTSLILLLGSTIMMFITSWILALAAILSSIIGFLLVSVIIKHSQKYFFKQQKEVGQLSGFIEESYSNHEMISVYNAKNITKERFDNYNVSLKESARKGQFFSGLMMPLMGFIGNLGFVVVSVLGSILFFNGKIEFGVIVAFMMYIRFFTQPLSRIAQAITNFQRSAAASERVFQVLEQEELEDESNKLPLLDNSKGEVIFDKVNFSYVEDKEIIKDFSAHIRPGQKIAIVGPTGAGKTTIVNLLMRFYEIEEGRILIDGNDIKDTTRENLHDQFSMVLQDTWIYNGTIYENIKYTLNNVSNEEVEKVCKSIGLDHFIKTMPKGYNTILNTNTTLSEGQRQLITIARAMVKGAPLLILDEATSSVDTRTEALIQRAMDILMEGKTSFIIAHRLSTIRNADLILVMDEGSIIEQGNHEELIKLDKFYANLYNSQFEL